MARTEENHIRRRLVYEQASRQRESVICDRNETEKRAAYIAADIAAIDPRAWL